MSRSMKKYSSGFHEGSDIMKKSSRHKNTAHGETSSNNSDYFYRQSNGPKYQLSSPPPAPMISPYKRNIANDDEVVEINSDSEEDVSYDNNNEEASPDRHRMQESVDTDKREDSNSSDVIFVGDSNEDIENLSWISSDVHLDPTDKVCAADFRILKLLGTGAYGRVYLVKKLKGLDEGNLYAMKVLEKVKVMQKKKTTEHTRTEREVLEKIIDCPFLAKMYYAFQTPEKLYLVLGFEQGGELFTHLYKSEHFMEAQVRFYIAEIIVALEQLHKLQVIYRDIKLENILLDAGGHIVITDFGLSKELKDGARTHSFCGTIEYMAPEIVSQCREGHDLNVDWWSVGVLMIELLTGQSPFSRDGEESNQSQISERIQNEPPNIPASIAESAKDLIVKLLEKTPKQRLGFRNDAEDLKRHEFFKSIDWALLKKKFYKAPIIPHLKNREDVSQFAEDFTKQDPEDLPAEKPSQPNAAYYFRGYSFVAPKFRRKRCEETKTSTNRPESERPDLAKVLQYQSIGKGKFFKNYKINEDEQPIGDGTYSICVRCFSKDTGKFYAVKIMNLLHDSSQEIAALEKCQGHENIVEVVENLVDSNYKYIVFELLNGGELFQRIRLCNHFMEPLARSHFRQLVNAVEFMHRRNIVHRDLKPENIMFVDHKEDSLLKIVDFGFARRRTSDETPPCFTLDYAAPESLTKGTTKESRDMWSLGVILYTMMCGNTPFMPKNIDKQRDEKNYRLKLTENIKRGDFNTDCPHWENLSREAKNLIASLLQVNEADRLTLDEVLEHPWMASQDDDKEETEKEEDSEDQEPIIVEDDDDIVEVPTSVENKSREENCSNDSSGIVLSDRNEGSSLSSHEEAMQALPEFEDVPPIDLKAGEEILIQAITETTEVACKLSSPEVPKMSSKKTRAKKREEAVHSTRVKQETHHEPLTILHNNLDVSPQKQIENFVNSSHFEETRPLDGFQGFSYSDDSSLLLSLEHWRQLLIYTREESEVPLQRGLRPRKQNIVYNDTKKLKLPSQLPPTSVFFNETEFTITELSEPPKKKRGRPKKIKVEVKSQPEETQLFEKIERRGRKRKAEPITPKVEKKPKKQRRVEVEQSPTRYPKRQRNKVIIKAEPNPIPSVITHTIITATKLTKKVNIKREKAAPSAIQTVYTVEPNFVYSTHFKNNERPSMIQERRNYL